MAGSPWGLLAQGIANTISAGVTYGAGKYLQKQYSNYAETLKGLAEQYSGESANARMTEKGRQQARRKQQQELDMASSTNQNQENPMAGALAGAEMANNASNSYGQGYSEGAGNENTRMKGEYNKAKAEADAKLEQANTNYKAGMSAASGLQAIGSALGSLSDERNKEGINNDSGLDKSNIEDSLRQIETVQYKYKDSNIPGCDDEEHKSGVIAQSLEKTPLYKDAVQTGSDGYKRIDEWKLLEAVTAGISQLQREIDELEKK